MYIRKAAPFPPPSDQIRLRTPSEVEVSPKKITLLAIMRISTKIFTKWHPSNLMVAAISSSY